MPAGQTIMLRIGIENPVPGVTYSLQDARSAPVGPVVATEAPLSFEVPVRVAPGPRFLGEFVRREGAQRRFVYIAIGAQAGDDSSLWSRRVKIDIHDLPIELVNEALAGRVLECTVPGRDKEGGPACATLRPLNGWRVVA